MFSDLNISKANWMRIALLGFFISTFAILMVMVFSSKFASAHGEEGVVVMTGKVMEMKPATTDTHHMEVKAETLEGFRIPYMKITVIAVPEGGGKTVTKVLDSMFGTNFHYGANMTLEPKKYTLTYHVEPPTFMREGKRANQWLEEVDATFPFDAAASIETAGKIGTKEIADMKILFEAETAESMYVLAESVDTPMMGGDSMMEGVTHDDADRASGDSDGGSLAGIGILGLIIGLIIGKFILKPKSPVSPAV
ncbi:MAG: iron transporter [bacterium]|nr:iron transporter [bacterium]